MKIPDSLEKEKGDVTRFIAAMLYEVGELSFGQAAKMCNMTKWEFPAVLAKFNVNFFQYTAEEIMSDLERINGGNCN